MARRTSLPLKTHHLYLVPPEHTKSIGANESSDEFYEETDTHHPLPELLEQFQQLKDQFASLKSIAHQSTPMV